MTKTRHTARIAKTLGAAAIAFGGLTVLSGGGALFGGSATSAAVGDAVSFVLWFNFVAGLAYIAAGIGLIRRRPWAGWLAAAIAGATLLTFIGLGFHIVQGGPYEMRTVGAMSLRSAFWIGVAVYALRSNATLR